MTARQMCGVKCVFTFFISSGQRVALQILSPSVRERVCGVIVCVLSVYLTVFYHPSFLCFTPSSLSLSVETHSSFNSFSPEENLMAQILLLMLFFIELNRRYFFSNLLRINKSLWNSIITFPQKNLVL